MKIHLFKTIFFMGVLSLMVVSCNQSSKSKQSKEDSSSVKEASVEAGVFDAVKMKDQIVEIIHNTPKAGDIVALINKTGASYISDVTVPVGNVEKLMTATQQGPGLGMYTFDLQYSNVYGRGDVTAQIANLEKQLIIKMGLQSELTSSENYVGRLKENAGNKDSLNLLVTEAINFCAQKFDTGEHPDIYALSFIGINVEALHVLTQLTLLASNNADLLVIVNNQKENIKSVFTLLEMMSGDENIKPYYESMKPIAQFFQEKQTIGAAELLEIAPTIEKARNGMIQ